MKTAPDPRNADWGQYVLGMLHFAVSPFLFPSPAIRAKPSFSHIDRGDMFCYTA